MPIKRALPPPESEHAVTADLAARANLDLTAGPMASRVTPVDSLPQYSVNVGDIQAGVVLRDVARPAGWRHLVKQGGSLAAGPESLTAAEVDQVEGEHRVVSWNRGQFNAQLEALLADLQGSDQLQDAEYEPRFLAIPALCVYAIWLDQESGTSRVVPLAPTDPSLVPHRVYTADEFMVALQGSAARRLATEDPA